MKYIYHLIRKYQRSFRIIGARSVQAVTRSESVVISTLSSIIFYCRSLLKVPWYGLCFLCGRLWHPHDPVLVRRPLPGGLLRPAYHVSSSCLNKTSYGSVIIFLDVDNSYCCVTYLSFLILSREIFSSVALNYNAIT